MQQLSRTSSKSRLFILSLAFLSQIDAFGGLPAGVQAAEVKLVRPAQPLKRVPEKPKEKEKPRETASIIVSLNVPRNTDAVEEFVVSPYPVRPVKLPPLVDLPTDANELHELLKKTINYRWGTEGTAPPDWRVDRAFHQALDISRKHCPVNEVGLDTWIDEFVPYMKRECRLINEEEQKRREKYDTLVGYPDDYLEQMIENAQARDLQPIKLRVRLVRPGIRQARASIPLTTWWIIGKHSVAGQYYYWQEQVLVVDGPRFFELNEKNALAIEGHM